MTATPTPAPEPMTVSQLEKIMSDRLDRYDQSLTDMKQHVATLQHQLLDMVKIQFGKLAEVITEKLHLPQDQANILRELVDDQIRQLAATAQLHPTREPQQQPPTTTPPPALVHGNLPPQSAPARPHSRDPRIARSTTQMEG